MNWQDAPLEEELPAAAGGWQDAPLEEEPAAAAGPTAGEALARGVGQGATLGFMDELAGVTQAAADQGILGTLFPLSKPLMYAAQIAAGRPLGEEIGGAGEEAKRRGLGPLEQYREARDAERAASARAQEAHPVEFGVAQLAGGLPLAVASGPSMRAATALGAAAGLGGAEGDLTRGEVLPALAQTAVGAGLGAAGQKVGQQLARPISWLAQRAGKGVAEAAGKLQELARGRFGKEVAEAAGALGGEVQKGNRFVENLMRLGSTGTPQQKAAIQAMEQAGILQELRERLLDANIGDLPAQAGLINARQLALQDLQNNATKLIAKYAQEVASPWAQLKPRLQRYAAPALGSLVGGGAGAVVGGGVGLALGGGEGGTAGAVAGGLAGAGARPAARALVRMAQHPAIAGPAWGAVEWLATRAAQIVPLAPRALGMMGAGMQERVARAFRANSALAQRHGASYQQALERGPEALEAWHEVTKQRDPAYRAALEES